MKQPDVNPEYERMLAGHSPQVRATAGALRALIRTLLPNLDEMPDPSSAIIAYGRSQTYKGLVCAIAPFKKYVNLMLARSTELPDPHGILLGTGKIARHARLMDTGDVEKPEICALLLAAFALPQ